MKELIIIAGANGSGKTTFSKPLIAETTYAFLNADEIERELDTPDTAGSKLKAGRLFFQRLDELMNAGQGFILESTLAGKYLMKVIENAKNKVIQFRLSMCFWKIRKFVWNALVQE